MDTQQTQILEKSVDASPGYRTGVVKVYNGSDFVFNIYYQGKFFNLAPKQSVKVSEEMAKLIFAWEANCPEDYITSMRLTGIMNERAYREVMSKVQITPIVAKEE